MAEGLPSSSSSTLGGTSSGGDQSSTKDLYYMAKTVLGSGVIHHGVRGHIRSPSSDDIVFCKGTSIELLNINENGIAQSICHQLSCESIEDLVILPFDEEFHPWNTENLGQDILVIFSHSMLSLLTFSVRRNRFVSLSCIEHDADTVEKIERMLVADSNGCYIATSAFKEKLALYSVSREPGSDIISKKIFWPRRRLNDGRKDRSTWRISFISKDLHQKKEKQHNPLLAIIRNSSASSKSELLVVEWNIRESAINMISKFGVPEPLVHHIVEVPKSYGSVVLCRAGDVLLMDFKDANNPCIVCRTSLDFIPSTVEEQSTIKEDFALLESSQIYDSDLKYIDIDTSVKPGLNYVCSWSWEPGNVNSPRMIFSADSGDLFMMKIVHESDGVKMNLSDSLYKGLPSKALLWVGGGFLATIIDMDDGMVLKLEEGGLNYRSKIQNLAPMLDMTAVINYDDEENNPIFACCGMSPESLWIRRSGICTDILMSDTKTFYQWITATWAVKMKCTDSYHSFLVLSFLNATRVLAVDDVFKDVTDFVGFQPEVCTLACGLVADNLLVQIHQNAVCLCPIMPMEATRSEAIPLSHSWFPDKMSIVLGAVGHNLIVVTTNNPSFLYVLGIRSLPTYTYEIIEMQQVNLGIELSCICIPKSFDENKPLTHITCKEDFAAEADIPDTTIIVGTHKPSVEVLSYASDTRLQTLAIGNISLTMSDCIPEDVRLVSTDGRYILSGLRNGMLLKFEWPHSSSSVSTSLVTSSCLIKSSERVKECHAVDLHLIAVRQIGIKPVVLIPLSDSLDADIIVLCGRPRLLQTASHGLSYTSISFQPSSHATPVCSFRCPEGILFVVDSSLHLVVMVPSKRLDVQKFHIGGTPTKVLYHVDSRLLLVLRTELGNDSYSSDVCCVDPHSGSLLSSFKFEPRETGKCMALVKVGHQHVLVVGTASVDPAIKPIDDDEDEVESTSGRMIVLCIEELRNSGAASVTSGSCGQGSSPFRKIGGSLADQTSSCCLYSNPNDNSFDGVKLRESRTWHLRSAYIKNFAEMVPAVCPFLEHYFLASTGKSFYVFNFQNDDPRLVQQKAMARIEMEQKNIQNLTTHLTTIFVTCPNRIFYYTYHEDEKELELFLDEHFWSSSTDFVSVDGALFLSDIVGRINVFTSPNHLKGGKSHHWSCKTWNYSYYIGEISMCIRKVPETWAQNCIMSCTSFGRVMIFIPISRVEYDFLKIVEAKLFANKFTAPAGYYCVGAIRTPKSVQGWEGGMLIGDILDQFLHLTYKQQEDVLALPLPGHSTNEIPISVNEVLLLLGRIHSATIVTI